ncbi:LOW QUALITY PROTEIN: disease resistance protein RPS6-like [Raphanus sativus]|uniref:ADP-ribosyl cyclase/cyclic ADP-ribose hydrolase n=1 Tax=Raphanus sativus TaxID=3726 RepID=A0A9W3BYA5_RAPSA|nr:LOW QUALITY PROTEIN: disease resistance protein RPS6-like [Raphanus sativus]
MSSSSSSCDWVYDVFPSFRGEDVRKSFFSHFLKELDRKLISAFKDMKIQTSESLDPVLKQAIKDSRIAIVIFSQNYASSSWCLNELLEIVKCQKELSQIVIPVFYDLDPCHVRHQTKDFGEVFKKTCLRRTEDEIKLWRKALTDVANLVGYHSQNWENEAKMIEVIANDVLGKLNLTPSKDFEDFVGIEEHMKKMSSLLCLESKEVKMIGIWGPSGIGKSIIARALESRLSRHFHGKVFIDMRFISKSKEFYRKGNSDDINMKLHLQENFLSKILDKEGIKVDRLNAVREKLKRRKVLIFIDDLDDQVVLDALAGGAEWFGPGSRIIAITKDMQILRGHGITCVYEVKIPTKKIALQMLCRSAFRQDSPPDGFVEVAAEVAMRLGGLPLGLNIIGSALRGRDKTHWVNMLPALRKGLDGRIEEALSFSYKVLERNEYKALFRHLACLFNGDEVSYIKLMLADSELNVDMGLEVLVDKSLIRVVPSWNNTNIVEMHCLVQEMGKEVVRGQSDKPGEREFLMDSKDVCNVLKDRTGSEKLIGIAMELDEIDKVKIHEKAFKRMSNLRFLKFYKRSLEPKKEVRWQSPKTLNDFPDELKLLSWPGYPMESMPSNFCPEYLVELSMPNSKLKKLWKGVEELTYLKDMDLSGSKSLKKIPDLSTATNLETLNLHGCSSLVELPSSIQNLNKLTDLNMAGCTNLETLPNGANLKSLIRLVLTGCSQLKVFPDISSKIESIIANKTAFEIFPTKLRLENLVELRMEHSMSKRLWEGVQPLTSLTKIVLSGSKNLKEIPDLSLATSLETLNLNDCSSLVELTCSSIQNLNKLTTLEMIGCSSLETLPTGINLKSLLRLNLNGCSQLKSFPDISDNISTLLLNETAIEEVPPWIENFSKLESLEMWKCKNLATLPTGINLKSLYRLNLSGCPRLKSFPDISSNISNLYLNQTAIEEVPPWINNFSSLEALEMWECRQLRCISPSIFKLESLDEIFFSDCEQLAGVSLLEEAEDTSNKLSLISFTNCINLNQENFIQQSVSKYLILPGVEVPPYFTHRSTAGSIFNIPLHHSSLSQQPVFDFKACVVVSDVGAVSEGTETATHNLCFIDIEVHCRLKDSHGNYSGSTESIDFSLPQEYDHLIIFDCPFRQNQESGEPNCEQVEIEFSLVSTGLRLIGCGLKCQ